jgi:hypothetical protein
MEIIIKFPDKIVIKNTEFIKLKIFKDINNNKPDKKSIIQKLIISLLGSFIVFLIVGIYPKPSIIEIKITE